MNIGEILGATAFGVLQTLNSIPVEQKITATYPNSGQIKGKAYIDSNRKNGYYYEYYSNGSRWIVATLHNGILYFERYEKNDTIFSTAEIQRDVLVNYKVYHPQTKNLMYELENVNGLQCLYAYKNDKREKIQRKDEEKCLEDISRLLTSTYFTNVSNKKKSVSSFFKSIIYILFYILFFNFILLLLEK